MDRLLSAVAKAGGTLLTKAMPVSKKAIEIVAEAFGVSADNPDALALAIEKDPDAAVKLAEIQSTTKVELQRIILQSEIAHLEDTQDARSRETALAKITKKRDLLHYSMAYMVIIPFVVVFVKAFFWGLPPVEESNQHTITGMHELMKLVLVGVMGYYFGSSKRGNSNDTADGTE